MYNLQTAKEEIAQVAKHTSTLTEYVMTLSERVQAHESLDAKLNDFKASLLKEIESKFTKLEHKIFGAAHVPDGVSAVAELGHKIAGLAQSATAQMHPSEHPHDERHPDPSSHEHHG